VQKGIARILEAGKKHGKAVGILAPVEKEAQRYLEMGMTYVAVGGDTGLFRGASKALCDRFKKP
jgi:2-dehydro-3-deoxyglucarate aldolase